MWRLVDAHLAALYPERAIRVINRGVGGNTCRDVAARWQKDVLGCDARLGIADDRNQ